MSSPKSACKNSLNLHRCRFTYLCQIQWIPNMLTDWCSLFTHYTPSLILIISVIYDWHQSWHKLYPPHYQWQWWISSLTPSNFHSPTFYPTLRNDVGWEPRSDSISKLCKLRPWWSYSLANVPKSKKSLMFHLIQLRYHYYHDQSPNQKVYSHIVYCYIIATTW